MSTDTNRLPEIFNQINANNQTINRCRKHRFAIGLTIPNPVPVNLHYRCVNCSGWMLGTMAAQYAYGYKAAGGDLDDVMPGLFGDGAIDNLGEYRPPWNR